jgi:hypothetical protein
LRHQESCHALKAGFEQVFILMLFNNIQVATAEKAAIATKDGFSDPFGQAAVTLFDELRGTVARIGVAATKPMMGALAVFGDKTENGMVALLPFFVGIVALGGALLGAVDAPHRGIQVQRNSANPLF